MTRTHKQHSASPAGAAAVVPMLAIVADDLTGACDAAIAFAGVSKEVRVQLVESAQPRQGVGAITTDSRDTEPRSAARRLQQVLAGLPRELELFKKVDSVFRGNTALEISATVRCCPDALVLIAPAYPALGRRVANNILHIEDLQRLRQMPLKPMLEAHGCPTTPLAASLNETELARAMERALKQGGRALLCDATSSFHLAALARAARNLSGRVVWVGSGGLAHALAGTFEDLPWSPDEQTRMGNCIFCIGSDHAATQGQVLHLERLSGIARSRCDKPGVLCAGGLVLEIPREEDEAAIRHALSAINPADTGCLFMTGGDTARLVCRALGIRSLRLLREFAPGVPLGMAEGGPFDGTCVILKSGAFGSRDLLRHVLESFYQRLEVSA